ncbi:MAG: rhomboid family intramembrane serine protease [Dehalococcoidia bacterium]
MIPIGDSVPSRSFSYVNYSLIVANVVVFFYELSLSAPLELNRFIVEWGVVPRELTAFFRDPSGETADVLVTPFTAMFLHGGWFHLLGNMLFLWVFGDNVEDAMGHIRYLAFYILGGLGATTLQVYFDSGSPAPMIGASGAIAGVLGAYLVLYPMAYVLVLVVFFPFAVPAVVMIGSWFLIQLLNGIATVGYAVGAAGGVAWWAHVGGFGSGLVLVGVFRRRRPA